MNRQASVDINEYLTVPSSPIQYHQPDFDVLEKDKTPDWYAGNIRFYSRSYNQRKNNIDPFGGYQTVGDANSNSEANSNSANLNAPVLRGEADDMRLNFSYYFGRQPNIDFNYVTTDSTGKSFSNPWIRGKHAAKLVDFLKGPALKLLSSVKFTAQTLSKEAASKKGELFNKALLKMEMKEYFSQMEALGVSFSPTSQNFDMMEEVEDWMRDYKDEGELLASNMSADIYALNKLKYVYVNAWLHTIVGGIGAVYNYVSNGRVKKQHIPCYNLIWDSNNDGDFNERGQYVGFIEFLTPQEIFSKYRTEITKTDLNTIKALAEKKGGWEQFMNFYNAGSTNFQWYQWRADELRVGCVTMFWIGPRDLRWKKYKAPSGEDRYRKLNNYTADDLEAMNSSGELSTSQLKYIKPEQELRGDYDFDDVHKGVLIGNRILVDYGYNKNRIGEWKNKGNPELPIKLFIPNLTAGEVRSTMGMLRNNQDEIDRLGWEIRQITGKSQGKIPVFDASLLQAPYNDPYKLADLAKDVGFLVVNKQNAIDPDATKRPIADYLDLSGNAPMIQQYIALKQEEERTMEEILNLSKVALGQNSGYISQGAQQNTAAYSSMGTAYLFDGFMHFIENDTRYGTNTQKLISAMDDEDEMVSFIAGTNGITWSKITQERRFEDCLIFVQIADIVDEQARQRLLAYAQNWSQNPEFGVRPLDIVKLEKATTYSEMVRILELSLKKGEMKQQQQQAYNDMQAKVMAEKNNQAQMQQEDIRQEGANQRTAEQVKGKLAGDILKHHAGMKSAQQSPSQAA